MSEQNVDAFGQWHDKPLGEPTAPSPHGQDVEGLRAIRKLEGEIALVDGLNVSVELSVREAKAILSALRSRVEPENGVVSPRIGVPNEVLDRLEEYAASQADGELIAFDIRHVCRALRGVEPEPVALLDTVAQKAAWMLEHGATNENADLCRDVISFRTLYASPVAPAWRPIETAPKDGTQILVFSEDWDDRPVIGKWSTYHSAWLDDSMDWEDAEIDSQPTHWMPLPAPPARSEEP